MSPTIERRGGHDHVANRLRVILYAVDRLDRIGHLDEGDGVHQDHRVVAGDHLLLLDIEDDVLGGDLVGDDVDVGNDEAQTRQQRGTVFAEALHDPFFALRDDAHTLWRP
jgi:hypothetical protein